MPNPNDPSLYSQIDVTSGMSAPAQKGEDTARTEMVLLLREILRQQQQQTAILSKLLQNQMAPQQRQQNELAQWRTKHPELAEGSRGILDALTKAQSEQFTRMLDEVCENSEGISYNEYDLNDFLDRFGPRMMHINGLLQMFSLLVSPEIPRER